MLISPPQKNVLYNKCFPCGLFCHILAPLHNGGEDLVGAQDLYLNLRSVSSLNNPQSGEMKFCENMKILLEIIIIIIGYTLNNFTNHNTQYLSR
jgi:hypothetical protein